MERTCKKCGETKPIEEFAHHKTFQGNDYICFSCKREILSIWRQKYENKNRERITRKSIKYQKNIREMLGDLYIIQTISYNTGISKDIIREHPELIEIQRLKMGINRLIKNKKNEKCNRLEK
jgi:hypothetical protein